MRPSRRGRLWAVWAALVAVASAALAQQARAPDPMKEPLDLAARARDAFAKVKDYSCRLIKRERLGGQLSPNHLIDLKVRHEPFSVSMVWLEPKELQGQEVVYVAGKNEGHLRVRPGGLLGSVGFISLPTDDPRTRKTSKHKITEAGIGALIEQCHKGWQAEQKLGVTQVRTAGYSYAKRTCTRVELTHTGKAGGAIKHYRNVVYFDRQSHLPVRVENYGWPNEDEPNPPLVESFSYVNMRLDAGLPDSTFER